MKRSKKHKAKRRIWLQCEGVCNSSAGSPTVELEGLSQTHQWVRGVVLSRRSDKQSALTSCLGKCLAL